MHRTGVLSPCTWRRLEGSERCGAGTPKPAQASNTTSCEPTKRATRLLTAKELRAFQPLVISSCHNLLAPMKKFFKHIFNKFAFKAEALYEIRRSSKIHSPNTLPGFHTQTNQMALSENYLLVHKKLRYFQVFHSLKHNVLQTWFPMR